MIESRDEFQRMFEVEQKLWWYDSLHRKVLRHIRRYFGKDLSKLTLLDAACGTGGLLCRIKKDGLHQATGFDLSDYAVAFSKSRGLDVESGNLKTVDQFRPGTTYDVICCNDALYFLSDDEIVTTLEAFKQRLAPGGLLLVNIHAFDAFRGTHDLAVGSTKRFTLHDFRDYASRAGLVINQHTYWPFFAALPIYLVRSWQRFQIRRGKYQNMRPNSDVSYPGNFVNATLKLAMRVEENLFSNPPFGSSLLMTLQASEGDSSLAASS
jgi:SAM-dependent methyltransferase